jgi:hypothetical protein
VKLGDVETVEVPTGGRPDEALASAAARWVQPGASYKFTVAHDDGCPCVTGRSLPACTCEIVRLTGRRLT